MDRPENYYSILGVPVDVDNDTLKRAYRQLARRYHPDHAGEGSEVEMKRINRAYAILSDPEKRRNYDTVMGGVIDLRGSSRAHPRPHQFAPEEDIELAGLNIFSTRGPLHAGTRIQSNLGVISALSSVQMVQGMHIAAGTLDGKGQLWQILQDKSKDPIGFEADPAFTVESLRELRFSDAGTLLAGWGRLGIHVWDALNGQRLWSYNPGQRAVSAHYSLDVALQASFQEQRQVVLALPLLVNDVRGAPRAWGVKGSDIISQSLGNPSQRTNEPLRCLEEELENRQFWAIRLRALSPDARALVTLSCAHLPGGRQEAAIVRRWDLTNKTRLSGKSKPQISSSIVVGDCADCAPPYACTNDTRIVTFVYKGCKLRVCDTGAGTYSELSSGTMGSSSKLAIAPNAEWVAVAREDSEINEGVVDLWSVNTGQVVQKLYHPWQISALHFAQRKLVVALTDGTIQVWE